MMTQASFIIRPKSALGDLLKGSDLEETPFQTEPLLWTCDLADRSCWSRADVEAGIKEAFLHHLRVDFLSPDETGFLEIGGELTTAAFDRFWTIESFFAADQRLDDVVAAWARTGRFPVTNPFLRSRYEAAIGKPPTTSDSNSDSQ